MNDVAFLILKCVVSVAAALITAYLIPYIKARTSAQTQATITEIVAVAVKAAEQTMTMEGGKMKKEVVMDSVMNWLSLRGVKMTREQIDQLVECVVYEVKKEKKDV